MHIFMYIYTAYAVFVSLHMMDIVSFFDKYIYVIPFVIYCGCVVCHNALKV